MLEFALANLAALLLGIAKGGLKGLGTVAVALMAIAYGVKASTGIIVPLFIFGDILAVNYYKRDAEWKYLIKFFPAMVIGILFAVYFGQDLPEESFKQWMAGIILFSVALLVYRELKGEMKVPNSALFAGSTGIAAGFTTMIGNLAGGFSNLFFLSTGLSKNKIIGTAAWLFLIVNLFKMPFHIWSWGTINRASAISDLYLLPAVFIGFILGIRLVKVFSERAYRKFLMLVTALGAILIFLK